MFQENGGTCVFLLQAVESCMVPHRLVASKHDRSRNLNPKMHYTKPTPKKGSTKPNDHNYSTTHYRRVA